MKNIIKRKKTINLLLQSSELDFQFSISRLFWDEVKFLPSLKEKFPFWQWIQIEVQFIVYKGTHDQLKMNPKCSSDTIVVSIRSQRWQRNLPSVIVSDGIARRQQTQITASFEVQTRYVVVSIESLESSSTMSNAHWSHTCGRTGAVGMRGNRCNLKPRKTHNHGHRPTSTWKLLARNIGSSRTTDAFYMQPQAIYVIGSWVFRTCDLKLIVILFAWIWYIQLPIN